MKLPRFLIAAPKSGSGKTMITCGILRLLQRAGKMPSAFKCGPDYIDPLFHERVLKASARNLDPFFTDAPMTRYLLGRGAEGSGIAVMEGVMGYYDGLGGISVEGSAYDLARMTDTPVILVLDAKGMSVSVIPWIQGFLNYRPDSRIVGVILNRMSKSMFGELAPMIERELHISCIGYVPEVPECRLESRHLGLVLPGEIADLEAQVDRFADVLTDSLDLSRLIAAAEGAVELDTSCPRELSELLDGEETQRIRQKSPKIAVAMDEAFCFIYRDNLRLLEELGAVLLPFSPIHDRTVPRKADGILLYGGYPELYAKTLSENRTMLESIRNAIKGGMPCLAECGGYMYLSENMEDMEGNQYDMAGVVEGRVYRTKRLGRFGYVTLTARDSTVLGSDLGSIKAHEFHYFDSTDTGSSWHAAKPMRKKNWDCIHGNQRMLAGFPHLYYYANPELALEFLKVCCEKAGNRGNER